MQLKLFVNFCNVFTFPLECKVSRKIKEFCKKTNESCGLQIEITFVLMDTSIFIIPGFLIAYVSHSHSFVKVKENLLWNVYFTLTAISLQKCNASSKSI